MPNWSATNYAVRGEETELKEFCDLVNSLPSREDVHENGFGKYWLGNLVTLLGGDWKTLSTRGVIDPDPCVYPCLCGPVEPQGLMEVDHDGTLRFSTVTAWAQSRDFEDLLTRRFPSFVIAYRSTDEFGNFHTLHDPLGILHFMKYEVYIPDAVELYTDEEQDAVKAILKAAGMDGDYHEGMTFDEALQKAEGWLEEHSDAAEIIHWEEE